MKQDVRKLTFDKLKDYISETGLPGVSCKTNLGMDMG